MQLTLTCRSPCLEEVMRIVHNNNEGSHSLFLSITIILVSRESSGLHKEQATQHRNSRTILTLHHLLRDISAQDLPIFALLLTWLFIQILLPHTRTSSTMPIPIVDSAVGSWEQYPDYVQACRVIPSAGDPTSYTPAHPPRAGPTDITDFKVGMARWNESNLPRIMYQLWPCKEWQRFKDSPKPPQMKDAQGNLMVEHSPWPREAPRAMLDFPILKGMNKISTTVPWWFIEALMRLDPRLEWKDIDMRKCHDISQALDSH